MSDQRITEHAIQVAVVKWRDLMVARIPELELLHAIPNGAKLPFRKKRLLNGKVRRYSPEARKLIAEGLTSGIPDMNWPVPRGVYHGCYIEHKRPGAKVEKGGDQERKIMLLRQQGYLVLVSHDSLTTMAYLTNYWKLGPFDQDGRARFILLENSND